MSQCSILQVGHGPVDPSPEVVEEHDRVEVVGHLAGLGQGSYLGGLLAVGVHLPGDHLAQGLRPSSATLLVLIPGSSIPQRSEQANNTSQQEMSDQVVKAVGSPEQERPRP